MTSKVLYVNLIVLFFSACTYQEKQNNVNAHLYSKDTINIGKISRNDLIPVSFKLLNSSNSENIKIYKVSSECGCLILKDSTFIIKPKSERIFSVIYKPNIKEKGTVVKTIGLLSNLSPPIIFLYFKAELEND
ncbi:MAG TPA: DUF1573 domain-containing protein [Chitinophagaceae bacterium]|nr:DUF1573 domain-containing protein [Chitinophagaceae bacterium]